MKKDYKTGKFVETSIKKGKETAKTVKNVASETKETIKSTPKVVGKAVGKGALKVGKATYKGAAVISGIGLLGVEAAAKGVGALSSKINPLKRKMKSKSQDLKENIESKISDVQDYLEYKADNLKDYKDIAKNKIALAKNNMSIGIKSRIQKFAQNVVEKITPSLENSKNKAQRNREEMSNSRDNLNQKKAMEEEMIM